MIVSISNFKTNILTIFWVFFRYHLINVMTFILAVHLSRGSYHVWHQRGHLPQLERGVLPHIGPVPSALPLATIRHPFMHCGILNRGRFSQAAHHDQGVALVRHGPGPSPPNRAQSQANVHVLRRSIQVSLGVC